MKINSLFWPFPNFAFVNLALLMLLTAMSNTENLAPRVQCIRRNFQTSRRGDQEGDEPSDHEAKEAAPSKVRGLPRPGGGSAKEEAVCFRRRFTLRPAGRLHQAWAAGGGQLCHRLQGLQQPYEAGETGQKLGHKRFKPTTSLSWPWNV